MIDSAKLSNPKDKEWLGIWAIPKEEECRHIIEIKNKINHKLQGPKFPLHITLTGAFVLTHKELITLIPDISSSIKPLKLTYKNYSLDEYLFEAFYIPVLLSTELRSMRSKLCSILNTNDNFYKPHMSLYYGKESSLKKNRTLTDLPSLEGELNIDCLYIVSFNTMNFTSKILNKILLN